MAAGENTADKQAAESRDAGESRPQILASTLSEPESKTVNELLQGVGSVELKLIVPMQTHRATIEAIGLDPVEAQPRQAYFFDTPEFALKEAGLIVRARRRQGGHADTVVKLRPVDPATIDPKLRVRWRLES